MAEFHAHGGPYPLDVLIDKYHLDTVAIEMRKKCVASPLYLASKVMSRMWDRNLLATPSEAHREVERAMIAQRNTLYVDARGTAKTTLLDEVGTLWQGVKYPNDTQLITHSTDKNAKAISKSVRSHPERNETFKSLFPEYAMNEHGDEGNILAWSFPCRQLGGREESVEIATAGGQTAGRHYNVVRCSDWMNENTTPLYNLASIETMKNLVALFSQMQGLLKSKSVSERVHWTADSNRWHDGDLAGTILRRDKEANTVCKIIRGVTGSPGSFVSSWPEVITPQMIEDIYRSPTMTDAMFAANFRSDPLPDGGYAFKREWFKPYRVLPKEMRIAITMDPAFSDSKTDAKKTDRSAIVVTGTTPTMDLYVLEAVAGRWDETEVIDKMFEFMAAYNVAWVGIEDTGGSRSIIRIFLNEMRRRKRFVPYREIAPGGKSKGARIAPLHHFAKNWGIYVREGAHEELIEELIRFGVAEHDDLADALAYRMDDIWNVGATIAPIIEFKKVLVTGRDDTADGFLKRMHAHAQKQAGSTRGWKARVG